MKAKIYHLEIHVGVYKKSLAFYKDLLGYLEFKTTLEEDYLAGFSDGAADLWLVATDPKYLINKFHRKNVGLNHLAFRVNSKEEVNMFHDEFLKPRAIASLYQTPKFFPEYTPNYYAVYFEDPDRIKLEVVSL